jgi:malate dehydrogenase|tara:strand:+ start:418 stop:1353 length:936 start_codon:yes stop_codon:yes gene_type:complete
LPKRKIALVGGGQIGGMLALICSQKELGDVVIIDIPEVEGMVKGKALDIMQLRPHDGYDSNLSGSANFSDLANADVVAITAGIPRKPGMTREDLLSTNIKIISNVAENVKKYAPKAFVIVVSNPLDAIVYAFHKVSGFTKKMVVGMAGALDNARFRTFIAMETGLSVQDVSCIVMGGHGPTMVPITRTASVGGVPLTDLLSQEKIDSIVTRVQEAGTELVKLYGKGSAFFSPAAAIAEMIEAYLKDKKRLIPSAAYCEGEYGINGYFIGVPAIIGSDGVEKIIEISLTKNEIEQLEKTLQQVKVTVLETGL